MPGLRCQYLLDVSIYQSHPEFIDETGTDRRDSMRKFGYSLRGKPAISSKLMVRGQRVSAIVGMSCQGIIDFHTTKGTTNGEKFLCYIQDALIPHLQLFNGINAHSVIVLDNASVHHVPAVADALQEAGVIVQYLPPYSPDLNPIELAFSKVKSILKANESEWGDLEVKICLIAALNTITARECQEWISHCGY